MKNIQLKTLWKKSQWGLRQFSTVTFYLKFYLVTMNIEISFNGSQVLYLCNFINGVPFLRTSFFIFSCSLIFTLRLHINIASSGKSSLTSAWLIIYSVWLLLYFSLIYIYINSKLVWIFLKRSLLKGQEFCVISLRLGNYALFNLVFTMSMTHWTQIDNLCKFFKINDWKRWSL